MNDARQHDRRFATTLARGLSILRAFRPSDDGLGNLEIAERTGIPKSTVSRLTFTLQELGYLTQATTRDRYRMGPALLAIGQVASASLTFVQMASRFMQDLADRSGTLVVLSVRDVDKMLLVKTWRPTTASAIWLEPGHRIPIAGSSSGLAMMAALSDEEFDPISEECMAGISNTGFVAKNLRDDAYSQLIARGFVIVGENIRYSPTVMAVSVPFKSHEFDEPVSFTCGGTPEALDEKRMQSEVGPDLLKTVRVLEKALGLSSALLQRG